MTNMLNHVTWSRDQTGYEYQPLSHNFQLLAPAHLPNYSRRNSFTPNFELLFNSLFTLPLPLLLWSERKFFRTFPIYVFANLQLHLIETILGHFQTMSLPNFPLFAYPTHTLATWFKTSSTNANFRISVCRFPGITSVVKREWILNCTTLTRFLERDQIGVTKTKSHLVCCRGNLEFFPSS